MWVCSRKRETQWVKNKLHVFVAPTVDVTIRPRYLRPVSVFPSEELEISRGERMGKDRSIFPHHSSPNLYHCLSPYTLFLTLYAGLPECLTHPLSQGSCVLRCNWKRLSNPEEWKPDSQTPYAVMQPSPSAVLLFPSDQLNEIMSFYPFRWECSQIKPGK